MMQQRRMDYHLHSSYSFDARQSLDSLCRRAQEIGLQEICVTEHIEPGHPDPACDVPPDFSSWQREMAACREAYPQLTLRAGIEIGDNPPCREKIYDLLDSLKLDYHLLSLHLVDGRDPYLAGFYDGKEQAAVYRRYVEQRVESVLNFKAYDAVAHLGYIAKFAPYPKGERPLLYRHAPDAFDTLFRALAREGKALEINASGLIGMDFPIPGPDLIKRFVEMGGEFFTFGSDAHFEERVYLHVEEAKTLARAQGAKWQVGFHQRVMQVYRI